MASAAQTNQQNICLFVSISCLPLFCRERDSFLIAVMLFRPHSANWLTDLVNTIWLIADVMISPTIIRAPQWRGCRRQTRDTSPTTVIRLPRSDRPTVDFSRTPIDAQYARHAWLPGEPQSCKVGHR